MSEPTKKRNSNSNRRRRPPTKGSKNRSSKNRSSKPLTPARVLTKYDNLLEQYLVARRKYFEMYARTKGQTLSKISRNYLRSIKELAGFKEKLKPEHQEVLDKKIDRYPEDNQYTQEHNLPLEGEIEIPDDQIEDIHLTEVQRSTSYKDDDEESSGTMEDYEKYKQSTH